MSETTPNGPGPARGTCQWPGGCVHDAPVRAGGGRPAAYCGQEVLGVRHDRANAATRRRQLREAGLGTERAGNEPVTVARAAAGSLLARLETAIAEQGRLSGALLAELRTMGDPTAAAAQAAAATETARAEAASARAEAAQAATAQAAAETAQAAAEAARDAAEADAEAAETARAQAQAATDAAVRDVAAARAELADQVTATGEQTRRAETAEAAAAQRQQRLDAVTSERDALAGRLTQTLATLADVRETAAADAAAATARQTAAADQITRLTNDLTTTRTQINQLHADLRVADRTTAEQTARADRAEATAALLEGAVRDLTSDRDRARADVDSLRAELAQRQVDAAAAAAREASVRAELEQLRAELIATRAQVEQQRDDLATAQARLSVLQESAREEHRGREQHRDR